MVASRSSLSRHSWNGWSVCTTPNRKGNPDWSSSCTIFRASTATSSSTSCTAKTWALNRSLIGPWNTPVFGIDPTQNQIQRQLEPFSMPLADFLKAFCLQKEAKGFFPTFSTDPNTKRMWGLCPTSIITTQTAGAKNVATPLAVGMTVITLKHPASSRRFNFASKDKLTKKKD